MYTAEMFGEVLLPRETNAVPPFALRVVTLVVGFGAAILAMDLTLVAKQTIGSGTVNLGKNVHKTRTDILICGI